MSASTQSALVGVALWLGLMAYMFWAFGGFR